MNTAHKGWTCHWRDLNLGVGNITTPTLRTNQAPIDISFKLSFTQQYNLLPIARAPEREY